MTRLRSAAQLLKPIHIGLRFADALPLWAPEPGGPKGPNSSSFQVGFPRDPLALSVQQITRPDFHSHWRSARPH